jgi:hypothetical protein
LNRQIKPEDIYKCSRNHESEKVTENIQNLWNVELKTANPNLIWVATKALWLKVIIIGFFFGTFEMFCK